MSDFSVSVVIPLYNKAPFIRRTLESVLAQTVTPEEVIIVDDGSTDGGPEAIADLIHGPVRLVRQSNAGPGPARNRGAAEATSEWIALIDGDDRWSRNHLETLAEIAAAHEQAAVISTCYGRIAASATTLPAIQTGGPASDQFDYFQLGREEEAMYTSSVAVKRQVLLDVGGFGAFMPGEDSELWFRLALDYPMARSTRRTAYYVQQTGGIMDSQAHFPDSEDRQSPLSTAIDRALADPRYAPRHDAIRAFHRDLMVNGIKQALYHGQSALARQIIRNCALINARVPLTYLVLSMLSPRIVKPTVRTAARLRNGLASSLRRDQHR